MALDPADIAAAEERQHAAAQDQAGAVRLVAGPGTGKSATIEARVRELLEAGVAADRIYVISFTRASATELRERVRIHCQREGVAGGDDVSVTTLHSLALRVLRRAGLLAAYPAGPLVLDEWELKNVFDAEFSTTAGRTPTRSGEIRREHEAFWSTGSWNPPNWIPPDPVISDMERGQFRAFHGPRTQTYACVLPGEIVRAAVEQIVAGVLDARELLEAEHLIVDEFQDLNPADLEFIEHLTREGATTFVAGDDDQSIYSFRFADPSGIERFVADHPGAADHELSACFRCTPAVLHAALALITQNALPGRIAKHLYSLYETAIPPVPGHYATWRFQTHRAEALAIAESCNSLIAAGVPPREILILISDRNALAGPLTEALDAVRVPYEPPKSAAAKDTPGGRAVLAVLRFIADADDYVALRLLLGLLPRVGTTTCNRIAAAVVTNNLNYRDVVVQPLPDGVFARRELTSIDRVRGIVEQLDGTTIEDQVADRGATLRPLIEGHYGDEAAQVWDALIDAVPGEATLGELLALLRADSDEQAMAALHAIFLRLDQEPPDDAVLPERVRVMTMHRAKGLSARIVFIPGLEEEIFPGERRARYPGLVLEAARLLYVSITRGRAACFVTYSRGRTRFGSYAQRAPSRYVAQLGVAVTDRITGLSDDEAAAVAATCNELG